MKRFLEEEREENPHKLKKTIPQAYFDWGHDLSIDILTEIFSLSSLVDVFNSSKVCKLWWEASKRDRLWSKRLELLLNTSGLSPSVFGRDFFITLAQSFISVIGDSRFLAGLKVSSAPFWIFQFHLKIGRDQLCWRVKPNSTPVFPNSLLLNQVKRLHIFGSKVIWVPGDYEVRWGISLDSIFSLGCVNFVTSVDDPKNPITYKKSVDFSSFSPGFVELIVATIKISQPKTKISLEIQQFSLFAKYGLEINYIFLKPLIQCLTPLSTEQIIERMKKPSII